MTDKAIISIDFELFRHTPAYRNAEGTSHDAMIGIDAWPFLRDLFEEYNVTTTFFVVGEIAEEHPELLAEMATYDHEIGSHTTTHRLLSDLEEEIQITEIKRSKAIIEAASGQEVAGFRAPAFDLPTGILKRLEETGYRYDSSVIPARSIPGWYGGEYNKKVPFSASEIDPTITKLDEVPVSVMPKLRLPLSGAWTRLLGRKYTQWGMKYIANRGEIPLLYFHPWELVDIPPIDGVPKRVTWRTGEWLQQTLEELLAMDFTFTTVKSVLDQPCQ